MDAVAYPFRDLSDALKNAPGVPFWRMRKLHEIKHLVVHHTAGPADQTPEAIHRFHQEKNWGTPEAPARAPRLVYHYGVSPEGVQWKFNRTVDVTWHCPGHNRDGLSLVLFGDFTKYEVPFDQWQSAVQLAARLCTAYHLRVDRILGHREAFATACPGTYVNPDRFRQDVAATIGRAPA